MLENEELICPKCEGFLIGDTAYIEGGMTLEQVKCIQCGWRGDMAMNQEARDRISAAMKESHARRKAEKDGAKVDTAKMTQPIKVHAPKEAVKVRTVAQPRLSRLKAAWLVLIGKAEAVQSKKP
jgi:hypothetical protein